MKKAENDCGGNKIYTIERPKTAAKAKAKAKPAAKKAATKRK